jgi:hypothetical protein
VIVFCEANECNNQETVLVDAKKLDHDFYEVPVPGWEVDPDPPYLRLCHQCLAKEKQSP